MPSYLDNNATTPLDPRVLEAMLPYLQGVYGNPSSVHRYGRLVRGAIDRAREQVAALVNAHPSQIVFTASGTEANNLALRGVTQKFDLVDKRTGHIAISAIEHPSLRDPAFALCNEAWTIDEISVDQDGYVQQDALREIVNSNKTNLRLVSIMLANNETGVIQDVAGLSDCVQSILHTDASQAAGKIPVDFASLGVQLMTLSSHKLYGPLGAGALVLDKRVDLKPILMGGGQERNLRSGTENVAAIVGFGVAAELALSELTERAEQLQQLRSYLEEALNKISTVSIFAQTSKRLPNTVQFGVADCHGETLLMQLDKQGFAVSSGSACHSGTNEASHVLIAMEVPVDLALTAIRVSLGKETTIQEIDKFIEALNKVINLISNSNANAGIHAA